MHGNSSTLAFLMGLFTHKLKFSHHLLTLILFQTVSLFFLPNRFHLLNENKHCSSPYKESIQRPEAVKHSKKKKKKKKILLTGS